MGYVPSTPGAFKVVSHAQQLALSACAKKSAGRMWCGSCHDPHEKPESPAQYYRGRCLSCHGETRVTSHPGRADDCVSCHMQRRPAQDGNHTAFTDHEILRRADTKRDLVRPEKLVAWREPAGLLATRNLGLAYIASGRRNQSRRTWTKGFGC